ncbi:MAG: DUF975 family protein [Bacteroidaceae bacterium]|nr:DUF975 family protein [Bacteroidaceae bacterium]
MKISELKNQAIESLNGKWSNAAIITLIYMLIAGSFSVTSHFSEHYNENYSLAITIPSLLILIPLAWGFCVYFLRIARKENPTFSNLFDGFKDYVRVLLTGLLSSLYIFLWCLLLIIPGIIKTYSYALTYYILKDEPELRYNSAIERSMKMMDGHKMELFLLDLSFIGWYLLCIPTLGLAFFLVYPYHYTTRAHFYEALKQAEQTAE